MRMLFVADLHYALKQFDWLLANAAEYSAVVIGGDLLDLSSALDLDVQIVVMEKYLDRLRQVTRVIVSSGNHDGNLRDAANESVAGWLQEAKAPQLFVDGDAVEIGPDLITVCRWWDGPVSRAEVEAQFQRDALRQKAKWIWVHHAPPQATPVSWTGRKFAGDEYLGEWIRRFKPDIVLSGHIHNAPFYPGGSWVDRLGETWVFNPGRQPGPRPTCLSLDLEKMRVSWISAEGHQEKVLREELVPS